MTPEEVIKTLEVAKAEVEWNYPMDYAVAIDEAIKAVEKQIPKKPITLKEDALDGYNVCPVCLIYQDTPYCAVCGQRLNWEVEE